MKAIVSYLSMCLIVLFSQINLAAEKVTVAFGPAPLDRLGTKLAESIGKANLSMDVMGGKGISSHNVLVSVDSGKADCGIAGGDWESILQQAEKSYKFQNKDKLKAKVIGSEATYFLTNKGGPTKLSQDDLYKIFTDKVKNWKELGGADQPIQIGIPTNFKATVELLSRMYLKGETVRGRVKYIDDFKALSEFLKSTPGAIIVTTPNMIADFNHPEHPPLNRVIYFMTVGDPAGKVKTFLDEVEKVATVSYPKS